MLKKIKIPLKFRLIIYSIIILPLLTLAVIRYNYISIRFPNIPILSYFQHSICKMKLPKTNTFLKAVPNYNLSNEQASNLFNLVKEAAPKDKAQQYINFFKDIEKGTQEGFYILATFANKRPEDFKEAISNWIIDTNNENAAILIHEFTHEGHNPCFFKNMACTRDKELEKKYSVDRNEAVQAFLYKDEEFYTKNAEWVENLAITYKYDDSKLFSKNEITNPLDAKTSFDKELDVSYLTENDQTFSLMLDEINAYLKSSKSIRQLNCTGIKKRVDRYYYSYILSRQLYHMGVYLQFAKDFRPTTWNYLISNKELAYTAMRLKQLSEEEINLASLNASKKDKINSQPSIEGLRHNQELVLKNAPIFNEFFEKSKVSNLKNQSLTADELKSNGINFEIYNIN